MKNAHKIGAVFYILWGVIHVLGGFMIMTAGTAAEQLAMVATGRLPEEFAALQNDALNGLLSYYGFNIVWFGLFAIIVAAICNWKNIKIGYWLNTLVIGVVDLGLLLFLLMPGYMSYSSGGIGLSLYAFALIFSTIGYKNSNS